MSLKYDQFFGRLSAVIKFWFSSVYCKGFLIQSRDQWSDLSIILQLSNISCVKLVSIVLEESGVSSIRVLICWKSSQELMWALISELSRVLCSSRRVKRQRSVLPIYELLQPGQEN